MRTRRNSGWAVFAAVLLGLTVPGSALAAVTLTAGNASGLPGSSVEVTFTLGITAEESVGSFSNEVGFTADAPIGDSPVDPGFPNCTANVTVTLQQYEFRPLDCGEDCTGILAAILGPRAGLVAGTVYTCTVAIPADANPGDYEISVVNGIFSDPDGNEFPMEGVAGTVSVEAEPPTPTVTVAPTSTNTPVAPTVTNTPVPTSTRTVTPTFAPGGDDGCQMGSGDSSNALLALLLPIAGVLVLRRRSQHGD